MDQQRPPSRMPSSRSYDSLLPEDHHPRPGGEGDDEDDEDEEGVYMMPDFSNQDPAASWMAEDIIDFSPTFLEDSPIGLGRSAVAVGGRESPPTDTPPPYRCLSHQGHSHSSSQRSITEDPDSLLNQSDAAIRRSLIIAATAPPLQVFCQHRPANTGLTAGQSGEGANLSPSHVQSQGQSTTAATTAASSQPQPERRSFTRKMVNAFSQKAPKSPPLDISDPVSISVPAKVLDMIGGRAGELHQSVVGTPSSGPSQSQPPQMISMLLRSCDFQLTESCQQEIRSKLGTDAKIRGPGIMGPSGALLPSQPPPPPPKNPARLMALALTESANKALRQGASPPYRPPQSRSQGTAETRCQRSLSADAGELLSSDPNQLYSTVRPLSVWRTEEEGNTKETTLDSGDGQGERTAGQDTGTLSSGTSDSLVSNSDQSVVDEQSPSPVYNNQTQPPKPDPPVERPSPSVSKRKPPAYSRQFSAPHLQQKSTLTSSQSKSSSAHPHSQLLHSKSESSPLEQVRAFQPTRPKVPPKPLDLERPQRALLAKTDMRRSLDSGRIRRIFGQQGPQGYPPLSRAFSERLSGTPDPLSRYRSARATSQPAQIRPVPLPSGTEDQGKIENFYYEIAGPENPQGPPSYARHSYQNMRLDLDGNFRPAPHPEANQRPVSRGHPQHRPHPLQHNQGGARGDRVPQLWSSEATRAWAAAHSLSPSVSQSYQLSQDSPPHHHPPSQRSQRQASSIRPVRSEMHPLPSSSMVPLALHQNQRSVHHKSPSKEHTVAQLHPYFENGKVCYRKPDEAPQCVSQPSHSQPPQRSPPQALRHISKDASEPIYVNFPFTSPSSGANNTKSWTTTDLDGDSLPGESLTTPTNPTPSEDQRQTSACLATDPGGSTSVSLSPLTPDNPAESNNSAATTPGSNRGGDFIPTLSASSPPGAHLRSRSDPQSSSCSAKLIQGLSGKEIASLLIDKLDEEERDEGPSTVTSSTSSSPTPEHPPNPYPGQHHNQPPPAYNVYTPGPSRSRAPHSLGTDGFQRGDPIRRSSSGGQYRQAFDVMPSGDQVLKYYRTQDMPGPQGQPQNAGANPYPPREHYQEALYPNRSPHEPHPSGCPLLDPSTSPSAAFANLTLGAPRPYQSQPGGLQYSQHPFQYGPELAQYSHPPPQRDVEQEPLLRPQGLRNQRGLARQGSLPGTSPNWTIHTEGQTRSYC
ncbi:hypothetical protein UPYG_G00151330 [Umbra pygmaea]|uniref:Uncharacterized protein n=1 Tax=Umbra pygmaea TaxID=75934 RepID=A0ABD0WX09_UMBPY